MSRAASAPRAPGEFELIARYFDRDASARADVVAGIGDDAAVVSPADGARIETAVFTSPATISLESPPPAQLAREAVDGAAAALRARGAVPAWATLSLTLPAPDPAWLEAFAGELLARSGASALALVGGDTTRGPLTVVLTVHGPREDP